MLQKPKLEVSRPVRSLRISTAGVPTIQVVKHGDETPHRRLARGPQTERSERRSHARRLSEGTETAPPSYGRSCPRFCAMNTTTLHNIPQSDNRWRGRPVGTPVSRETDNLPTSRPQPQRRHEQRSSQSLRPAEKRIEQPVVKRTPSFGEADEVRLSHTVSQCTDSTNAQAIENPFNSFLQSDSELAAGIASLPTAEFGGIGSPVNRKRTGNKCGTNSAPLAKCSLPVVSTRFV